MNTFMFTFLILNNSYLSYFLLIVQMLLELRENIFWYTRHIVWMWEFCEFQIDDEIFGACLFGSQNNIMYNNKRQICQCRAVSSNVCTFSGSSLEYVIVITSRSFNILTLNLNQSLTLRQTDLPICYYFWTNFGLNWERGVRIGVKIMYHF